MDLQAYDPTGAYTRAHSELVEENHSFSAPAAETNGALYTELNYSDYIHESAYADEGQAATGPGFVHSPLISLAHDHQPHHDSDLAPATLSQRNSEFLQATTINNISATPSTPSRTRTRTAPNNHVDQKPLLMLPVRQRAAVHLMPGAEYNSESEEMGDGYNELHVPQSQFQHSMKMFPPSRGQFSHDDYATAGQLKPIVYQRISAMHGEPASAPAVIQRGSVIRERNVSQSLQQPRFSGNDRDLPWAINQVPQIKDLSNVRDASLRKRKLSRPKNGKGSMRAHGANSPENIAIVNMKDVEGKSFKEIAVIINEQRIREGKTSTTLNDTACNSRYNRTAPVLYAARGEVFVPISQRGSNWRPGQPLRPRGIVQWDKNKDDQMVQFAHAYDAEKWSTVAQQMSDTYGEDYDSRMVSTRYKFL